MTKEKLLLLFTLAAAFGCGSAVNVQTVDAGTFDMKQAVDGGASEVKTPDGGGTPEVGTSDVRQSTDADGIPEAGTSEAGTSNDRTPDTETFDSGFPEAGTSEAGTSNDRTPDTETFDSGFSEVGQSSEAGTDPCSSGQGPPGGGSGIVWMNNCTIGTSWGVCMSGSCCIGCIEYSRDSNGNPVAPIACRTGNEDRSCGDEDPGSPSTTFKMCGTCTSPRHCIPYSLVGGQKGYDCNVP